MVSRNIQVFSIEKFKVFSIDTYCTKGLLHDSSGKDQNTAKLIEVSDAVGLEEYGTVLSQINKILMSN